MNDVFSGWRSKFRTSIDKNVRLVLRWQVHMYDHIRLAITGNVTKFQRNWHQVTARPQNIVGYDVTQYPRLTAGRKFHHDRLAIQVDSNEMARTLMAITPVPNHGISLVGTRNAIANVIVALHTPCQSQ